MDRWPRTLRPLKREHTSLLRAAGFNEGPRSRRSDWAPDTDHSVHFMASAFDGCARCSNVERQPARQAAQEPGIDSRGDHPQTEPYSCGYAAPATRGPASAINEGSFPVPPWPS